MREFDDARQATTPGLVGGAREVPVRKQLEHILPRGIAVGSGCVIDSYGNVSRQQDVVLYERDICPVFSINDTREATFYPCEGVIAVGEVKSSLGSTELENSFEKVASVKQLRRRLVAPPSTHRQALPTGEQIIHYRHYGSYQGPSVELVGGFDPDTDEYSQIFCFILSGALSLRPATLLEKFTESVEIHGDKFSPNLLLVLGVGIVVPASCIDSWQSPAFSAMTGTHFVYAPEENSFGALIPKIYSAYRNGKTSDAEAFHHYLLPSETSRSRPTQGFKVRKR